MQIDLNGKVAIVINSGNAIGAEICQVLAQNGAVVLAQMQENAAKEENENVVLLPFDVCDTDSVVKAAKAVHEKYGHIDILVNNQAYDETAENKAITDYNDNVWDQILAENVSGSYRCVKYFADQMKQTGSGCIIQVASVGGTVGPQKHSAMATASAGAIGFSHAMATELGQCGIRVNAVTVGFIDNDDEQQSTFAEEQLKHIPLNRKGSAKEVANAVAFLVSPEASYMTGATLSVDGGFSCGFMRDW